MGKRKLHHTSFYQCDYTGFPLRNSTCFMPTWPEGNNKREGKLVKKGSYANWESVAAHAAMMVGEGTITPDQHVEVVDFIHEITGSTYLRPAPPYEKLSHFKGGMTMEQFHRECCAHDGPINSVKITPEGEVLDILIHPNDNGGFTFADYMHKPYQTNPTNQPNYFHTIRKSRGLRDKELTVWYWADKGLPSNTVASNTFKMQLNGDIIMTQHSKEQSFLPRERYISFTKTQFDDQYVKKRRKNTETPSISSTEYAKVKAQMQASLDGYENVRKGTAVRPVEIAKVMSMPPPKRGKLATYKPTTSPVDDPPPNVPGPPAPYRQKSIRPGEATRAAMETVF